MNRSGAGLAGRVLRREINGWKSLRTVAGSGSSSSSLLRAYFLAGVFLSSELDADETAEGGGTKGFKTEGV